MKTGVVDYKSIIVDYLQNKINLNLSIVLPVTPAHKIKWNDERLPINSKVMMSQVCFVVTASDVNSYNISTYLQIRERNNKYIRYYYVNIYYY